MTLLWAPVAMNWAPVCRPRQTPNRRLTDRIPRLLCAPSLCCTRHAVDGKKHVRRDGADNDHVQSEGSRPTLRQSPPGRLGRQVAGGDTLAGDVALPDAGALHDPLIGRLDHLFQVGIGQQARRDVCSQGGNLGAHELVHSIGSPGSKLNRLFCRTHAAMSNCMCRRGLWKLWCGADLP